MAIDPSGSEMQSEQWNDGNAKCVQMLLDGRAQATGIRKKGSDLTLLLMFNAHHETVRFSLPDVPGGNCWRLLIRTDEPRKRRTKRSSNAGSKIDLSARSLMLWELQPPNPPGEHEEHS